MPITAAGDIPTNLIQHFTHPNTYRHILLPLNPPPSYLSAPSSSHDILGVAAIVGLQSIDYQQLYPGAGENLPGDL